MTGTVELAYAAIRERILAGDYAQGSWLREGDLADTIGVSRTPIREALRQLQSDGLVEVRPNRGSVVTGWRKDELDELYELRALIEGYCARRAAKRVTPEQVCQMNELCRSMELKYATPHEIPWAEITELNLNFHGIIHRASGSRRLLPLLSAIIHLPLVQHTYEHYTQDELDRSFAHHHELIDALQAGDSEWAGSLMECHVRAARASLRRQNGPTATRPET